MSRATVRPEQLSPAEAKLLADALDHLRVHGAVDGEGNMGWCVKHVHGGTLPDVEFVFFGPDAPEAMISHIAEHAHAIPPEGGESEPDEDEDYRTYRDRRELERRA